MFQNLHLSPQDCDKDFGISKLFKDTIGIQLQLFEGIEKYLSCVMGSIAKFVVFDNHIFVPLVEELMVIATSTIDKPTIDEVNLLILLEVVSDPPNIEHPMPTSRTPSQIDVGSNVNDSLPSTLLELVIDIGQSNIIVYEDPNIRCSKRQWVANIYDGYSTPTNHKRRKGLDPLI